MPEPRVSSKQGRYHFGLLRKVEYGVGERVPFSSVYECLENGELKAFKKGEVFTVPDETHVDEDDATWVATDNLVEFFTKNLNVEYEKIETFQLRVADAITAFAGTMGFVYFHVAWFTTWILMNHGVFGPQFVFDPYPYGFLTLVVSLEAIFLSTFILVSQNIQSKRSELRADLDYQTNLNAEKGVAEILAILKDMKEEDERPAQRAKNSSKARGKGAGPARKL